MQELNIEAVVPDRRTPLSISALGKATAIPVSTDSETRAVDTDPPPYSAFSKRRRWLIIFLSTFAASFSPLSSFIFFPAITSLSEALDVSVSKINLTVTSYLVVAAIAPAILGDIADAVGRRPVYLAVLGIYLCANVGLALQKNWAALLVLRMVQSFGSAATIALGYGVVADIATPAERGGFVSGMVLGPNIATAVGPIIGGTLAESPGWRWIFWLLSILAGACLFAVALLLPETARSIVGNGENAVSGMSGALTISRSFTTKVETPDKRKFHVPNPTASLRLLAAPDCLLITLIFGIFYMNLSSLQASLSTMFIRFYGISETQAGLVYLPSGIGAIIGAYGAGYILKHDYRVTARKHGITINVPGGDDMTTFPIEEARLRSIGFLIGLAGLCTTGYGWSVRYRTHIAVPLVLQFAIGLSTAIVFNSSGTLLTDVHPKSPSTASAANSIVRCLLAGAGTAVVQPLIDSIGIHWTFTLFGCLSLSCLGISWVETHHGRRWRNRLESRGINR
ncbi:MFS general substrate transporter [Pyrenochaeta sp. DS3sAY3a]|nr:MFS general substrate transporter [Pyrenochaeta sp. DS3sAY3a]